LLFCSSSRAFATLTILEPLSLFTFHSERRSLEYAIYDKELKSAEHKLEGLDAGQENVDDSSRQLHNKATSARDARVQAEEEHKTLQGEMAAIVARRDALTADQLALDKRVVRLELAVKQGKGQLETDVEGRGRVQEELVQLKKEIDTVEAQLAKITPDFNKCIEAETNIKARMEVVKARVAQLHAKQGRAAQFSSKKDRDAYINTEVAAVNKTIGGEEKACVAMDKDVVTLEADVAAREALVTDKEAEISTLKVQIDDINKEYGNVTEERNKAANARKELWRENNELTTSFGSCKEGLDKAERLLEYTMDKDLYRGLQTVKRAAEQQGMRGVHGPLIELFKTEKKFIKCVETTAGNQLFNVVVDNVDTAGKVIKVLQRERSGRVTFIPLAQIKPKEIEYPKSADVFPMVKKLTYEKKYTKAIDQVFSRTLVTRGMDVAAQFARSHNLDTITLDGDQVSKKGALTGGYIDRKRSRLEAQLDIDTSRTKFAKISTDTARVKSSCSETDQTVTRLIGELQKLANKREHVRKLLQQHAYTLADLRKEVKRATEALAQKKQAIAVLRASIETHTEKVAALRAEVGGPLTSELDAAEATELAALLSEANTLDEDFIHITTQRTKVETQKTVLEHSLNDNLFKRRAELDRNLEREVVNIDSEQLGVDEYELTTARDRLKELKRQVGCNHARFS
jgi:structural maintenance of chromosome 3 (chondroitin sulfate proteoglycan 6)